MTENAEERGSTSMESLSPQSILSDPNVSSSDLLSFYNEYIDERSSSPNIHDRLAGQSLVFEYLRSAYSQEGYSQLSTDMWDRLRDRTDIVENWSHISPQVAETSGGIFAGDITKVGRLGGISYNELNIKDDSHGKYFPSSKNIQLKHKKILWDILRNLTSNYEKGQTEFESLSTAAHEIEHDSTSSLQIHRPEYSGILRTIRTLTQLDWIRNIGKRRWQQRIGLEDFSEDGAAYDIRSSRVEAVYGSTSLGSLCSEIIADIASVEVGARTVQEGYTCDRTFGNDKLYREIRTIEDKDRAKGIERRLKILNELGFSSTSLAILVRNTVISEFEESRFQSDDNAEMDDGSSDGEVEVGREQLKDNLESFFNLEYLESFLDNTIEFAKGKRGVASVSNDELFQRLCRRSEIRNAAMYFELRDSVIQSLHETSGGLYLVHEDDVWITGDDDTDKFFHTKSYGFIPDPEDDSYIMVILNAYSDKPDQKGKVKRTISFKRMRFQEGIEYPERVGFDYNEDEAREIGRLLAQKFSDKGIKVDYDEIEYQDGGDDSEQVDHIFEGFNELRSGGRRDTRGWVDGLFRRK